MPSPHTVVVAAGQAGLHATGSLESITEIIRSLPSADLLVLTNRESGFTERWRRAGVEVLVRPQFWRATRSEGGRRLSRPRQAWRAAGTNLLAYRFLKRAPARAIHFNDPDTFVCIGFGAKLAGLAATIDVRQSVPPMAAYARLSLLACDRVVTLSDDLADRLEALRWMPGLAAKVAVIPSGVDRARVEAAASVSVAEWRARLGIDPSVVAIGVVGGVTPRKQQVEFARRTVPSITAASGWKVYFLGDLYAAQAAYGRRLRQALADSPRADRLRHVGFTDEIHGWYRALDLVVVTSTREGLARAMIEALSCGTPVVSFDVCSARALLGEGCGVVVGAQDFDGLARVLSALIDDPERRAAMGAIGARLARERFDSRLTGRRYAAHYASMLGDGPASASATPT